MTSADEVEKLKQAAADQTARINDICERLLVNVATTLGCSQQEAARHIFDEAVRRLGPGASREILKTLLANRNEQR
jgi:hypothetical protein